MNKENMQLNIGSALIIDDVINSLLFEVDPETKKVTNRILPFRLSYRLNRNKMALDKEIENFNKKKMYLLATYGRPTEDGTNITIEDKDNYEKYKQGIANLLEAPITHNVITLEEEDIDMITANIDVTPESVQLFIKYMMGDQELLTELTKKVSFNIPEFKEN